MTSIEEIEIVLLFQYVLKYNFRSYLSHGQDFDLLPHSDKPLYVRNNTLLENLYKHIRIYLGYKLMEFFITKVVFRTVIQFHFEYVTLAELVLQMLGRTNTSIRVKINGALVS